MRIRRALVPIAAGLVAVVVAGVLALRTAPARDWMWRVTGEEDAWEGFKGSIAATFIALGGVRLELAPDAPVRHVGVNPYGVNTFLQLEADPENVRRSLAAMRDAGLGWARQQFPWEDIEIHGRGDFEDRRNDPVRSAWDKYDRIVDTARAHGVQILARLDDPPDWAYAGGGPVTHKGPPDDLADYGNFVAAVVGRYCGRVRYYQLWNEPNIYPEWGERDADPAGYAALLAVGAARARAACPDVVIVSAALAQTTEPGGRNMDDLQYLAALYDAGAKDSFDVLGAQAFGLWTGPTDQRASRDRANFGRVQLARDIMVRRGDETKAVWITEMGWDSPPETMPAPYGRVSEDARARYTTAAYDRIAREWPWVGVACLWFLRRPNREWHERPEGYFRILEPDWVETPTYRAMVDLGARPPVARRGRHGPGDRALYFTGPWRAEPEEGPVEVRVGTAGAEVQVTFEGTGAFVDLRAGGTVSESLTVYTVLDGKARTVTPAFSADLWTPDMSPGGLRSATAAPGLPVPAFGAPIEPMVARASLAFPDLPNTEHVLILRIDAGEVGVTEILVTAPDVLSPLAEAGRWVLGVAAVAILVLLALGARKWRARRRRLRSGPADDPDGADL
jgi:polysaccharide biosynthesis protein PslG